MPPQLIKSLSQHFHWGSQKKKMQGVCSKKQTNKKNYADMFERVLCLAHVASLFFCYSLLWFPALDRHIQALHKWFRPKTSQTFLMSHFQAHWVFCTCIHRVTDWFICDYFNAKKSKSVLKNSTTEKQLSTSYILASCECFRKETVYKAQTATTGEWLQLMAMKLNIYRQTHTKQQLLYFQVLKKESENVTMNIYTKSLLIDWYYSL